MTDFAFSPIRRFCRFTALLLVVAGDCGELACAEEKKQAVLTVEIVTTREEGRGVTLPHGEEFEVRLKNHTAKTVAVWDRECEPGHSMLSFSVKGPEGERPAIEARRAAGADWSKYPLKKIVIPAGKTRAVKVMLSDAFGGRREWANVPEPNTGERLEVKAVLEIQPTEAAQREGVWTGRVESAPVKLQLVDSDLETPQQYLWANCPGMALKLMHEATGHTSNRAEADVSPFVSYFCQGMAEALENVQRQAAQPSHAAAPDHAASLRRLTPPQRQAMTFFTHQQTASAAELASHMGLTPRQATALCLRWAAEGFLEMANVSRKARRYRLATEWEHIVAGG